MIPNEITLRKSINKAYRKVKPNRSQIEMFKSNILQLFNQINEQESEEHHKNIIRTFLRETYYSPGYYINTKGRTDLVIHNSKNATSAVGVLIETKKPSNKAEMPTKENLNAKAMHELMLYYLRERITAGNKDIKHLIITNIHEWFVFDAQEFYRLFAQNRTLVKQFTEFNEGRTEDNRTDYFYNQIAKPFLDELETEITFTYTDIREFEKIIRNSNPRDDNKLVALFKLFSPEHLLKLPFVNDSNSLDRGFYTELLHIIGLQETKSGGKKLIGRKAENDRNAGSLIENTITILKYEDCLSQLKASDYGATKEEQLYNVALELVITWINRILFLKLLEGQLVKYHAGDKSFRFLNSDRIPDFDELNKLFFQVLAVKEEERNEPVREKYASIPYLNSSLFEPNELEHKTARISNLEDEYTLPLLNTTVLKDRTGKRRKGELNTLGYLFGFLDAYDFAGEGSEEIQEENKTLINASVLGLIFEKINGYKDGSFFTPGFITMYMARETIRRAVVEKFNSLNRDSKGLNQDYRDSGITRIKGEGLNPDSYDEGIAGIKKKERRYKNIDDVYNAIGSDFTKEQANEAINSLKICDPAVGSGHFLVSALNEMIALKSELKILTDRNGRTLRDYHVEVVNDELVVTDDEGRLFEYKPGSRESQRVQETLFHEKQTLIENCLFGVDINPNSVKICRLRLWIELLKNAYYRTSDGMTQSHAITNNQTPGHLRSKSNSDQVNPNHQVTNSSPFGGGREGALETLPNIDINIKTGNSLISRYALDADMKKALRKSRWNIDDYRVAVMTYRNAQNKEVKREMENLIHRIKSDFESEIAANDKRVVKLSKLRGELFHLTNQQQLFDRSRKEKTEYNKKVDKLTGQIRKLETELEEIRTNKIYENAFEWRFEFPEVLNDDGDFVGFDVVIGNPPYAVLEKERNTPLEPYKAILEYSKITKRYFNVEGGKLNLYRLFIKLAADISKLNNQFSFIIPLTLVGDNSLFSTRSFVLNNFVNLKFICFPQKDNAKKRVFEDAKQSTLILLGKKVLNSKSNSHIFVSTYPFNSFNDDNKHYNTDINNLKLFDSYRLSIPLVSEQEWNILKKIHQYQVIRDIDRIIVRRGEINQTIFRKYISTDSKLENLVKGVEIGPYEIRKKLSQGVKEYFDANKFYEDGKSNELAKIQRIATQRITGTDEKLRVVAALVEPISFFADSTNSIHIVNNKDFSIYFMLGLLNSKLIQWRFKKTSSNNNVSTNELESLPFILNKKYSCEIEMLSKTIIKIKKQDPSADTTALEAEIDQMVYALYGLTEEEVKVVEGEEV
ncbi:type II restriction m6 adenine DNA methyltransferase, Alw26I/Eco31I/Esp3I family [Tangfeifania diversioriginum]|uniref:site-specific DNA-methyltransferase (adenine-specific) n=1 Tax=Tangfeifania diversioriginum TaxID=1168035 RepID=A0A1M6NQX6_9BACT|nr:TaqI-like C-terminal specificity domain-containing protein [Tangfeifania diversioriginum]SHJ98068.1 type II restriction m6 adenine DNA methyltransferase, Alw26I/Eco31I/Esp3I family [Tangfeifania diversioriginum]